MGLTREVLSPAARRGTSWRGMIFVVLTFILVHLVVLLAAS